MVKSREFSENGDEETKEPDFLSYKTHLKQADEFFANAENDKAEHHYAEALKIVQNTSYAEQHVVCLIGLANIYLERKVYTKSIALYNAALVRAPKEEKSAIILLIKAAEVSFLYSIDIKDKEVSAPALDQVYKDRLQKLRDECRTALEKLNEYWESAKDKYTDEQSLISDNSLWLERAQMIKNIYNQIDTEYKSFISDLIEKECIAVLGNAPCKFAAIALGSLARGEATPYSDFEWAILIEEGRDNEVNMQYFENFTNLLHIKILNLGETILPSMAIPSLNNFYSKNFLDNWFYDNNTPRGISFDGLMPGACKYPLGEKDEKGNRVFQLINTPAKMAKYQYPEKDIKNVLASVLTNFSLISGEEELVNQYEEQVFKILNARNHDDTLSTSPLINSIGQARALDMLIDDLTRYDPRIGKGEEDGKLYSVKKEIYRFVSIIVENLALYSNLRGKNTWEKIEQLRNINFINKTAADNLMIAASIAAELRLTTYLANGKQGEDFAVVSAYNSNDNLRSTFQLTSLESIFRFYYTAIPLRREVERLCLHNKKETHIYELFSTNDLFDNNPLVKGSVHERLLQFDQAKLSFEEQIKINPNSFIGYHALAVLSHKIGDPAKALQNGIKALELYDGLYPLDKIWLLNLIGSVSCSRGVYKDAISYLDECLRLSAQYFGYQSTQHAEILINKGYIYYMMGDHRNANKLYQESSEIFKHLFGTKIYPQKAALLDNISILLRAQGQYDQSIKYSENALQCYRYYYGNQPNGEMAKSISGLGNTYIKLGKYDKATNLYNTALMIFELVCQEGLNYNKAQVMDNLATAFRCSGDLVLALKYSIKALSIFTKLHANVNDISCTLSNIGAVYQIS